MILLHDLQQRCYDAFIRGDTQALSPFVKNGGVDTAARIAVYQNNAREGYRKALAATYPVVEQLVGEQCFESLAADYYRRWPSTSGNLQHFGGSFWTLLDAHYGETEHAYLVDVARLEWACEEVQSAADTHPIDLVGLQQSAADDFAQLTFTLDPACRLLRSAFPIFDIWRAHQDETVDLASCSGAQCVLVQRQAQRVVVLSIDEATFTLLDQIQRGTRLIDAVSAALAATQPADQQPNPLLRVAQLKVLVDTHLPLQPLHPRTI